MTLTEQWKKGELGNGEYFVLTNLGIEKIEYIKEHNGFGFDETEWVEEVLAPVPSYEEWKAKDEENQQLKDLLSECNEFLYEILTGTHSKLSFKLESGIRKQYYMISLSELKTKIDNAIGEKE